MKIRIYKLIQRIITKLIFNKSKIYQKEKCNHKTSNRLCIFSSYDSNGIIHEYVVYYLKKLKDLGVDIIFVTTSPSISDSEIEKIKPYILSYIHRKNIGYDFGSWKTGLFSVDYLEYKQIIFANDSVYGPLFPLDKVFAEMEMKNYDMWGITDSYEIKYHIMSYFTVYNRSIIESYIFKNFWNSVIFYPNDYKHLVIENYEIGLSRLLSKAGFNLGVYCEFWNLMNAIARAEDNILIDFRRSIRLVNPTLQFWKQGIEYSKVPFLKKDLLNDNKANEVVIDCIYVLEKNTDYDVQMIILNLKE